MKTKLLFIVMTFILTSNVYAQWSTYTPLSPQEIIAPAMIMKQRYDNNADKVDVLVKYVLDLKGKTNDQQFTDYLDKCYQSLKKLYSYDLARMDNDIREYQIIIQEGVDKHIKRINKEAYCNQGIKEYERGLYDLAIAYYQKALEIDPNCEWTCNLMGIVYYNLRNYDQSIKYYQRAITISPNYSSAYNNLGIVYEALGNTEQQVAYYKRAAQLGSQVSQQWLTKNGYSW